MTRQAALERSDVIKSKYPILADAVPLIADPLVPTAEPSAETWPTAIRERPAGDHDRAPAPRSSRRLQRANDPGEPVLQGSLRDALARNEILTEIRIPAPPPKSGGAYVKLKRKTGDSRWRRRRCR